MMQTTIENLILNYFSGFTNKDIGKVTHDFDTDIKLKDWNGEWHGVGDVTLAIMEIFNNVEKIIISPKEIHYDELQTVTCLIDIVIFNKDHSQLTLNVVDIFTLGWDENEAVVIASIDAYKQ